MKKGIVYTLGFTLVVSFVFVFVLAAVNEYTRPLAERNVELAKRKGVLRAFRIPFEGNDDAYVKYETLIDKRSVNGSELYSYAEAGAGGPADANGAVAPATYYAVFFQGRGLWGTISGALAVNADVSRIRGIEIIEHSETPGLGGRIDEDAYKEQFAGEAIGPGMKIALGRTGAYDVDHENMRVDGVSGATRTSESVTAIVATELARLKKLIGDGNGEK